MNIHEIIKDAIKNHKQKIELTQWAIMSSISSLVYSEYLRGIVQKQVPVRIIMVPSIKYVHELLNPDNQFMQLLSEKLIDGISKNNTFMKYADAPELIMFQEDNIEIMKTIFDLYIIPNISRRIPETISKKFGLDDEKQQTFQENREADLFDRKPLNDDQLNYIIEETVLHLLTLLPTIRKDIEIPENNMSIQVGEDEIISIDHENAICAILLNDNIISNEAVIGLIKFVTSTNIEPMLVDINGNKKEIAAVKKNGDIVEYIISTNVFNRVALIKLHEIDNVKNE